MSALSAKLRKAREFTVESGDFVFTVLRPTDFEMMRLRQAKNPEDLFRFVIGWEKKDGSAVTEVDLGLAHGDPHPVPFDVDACSEFLANEAVLFKPVAEAIYESYAKRQKAIADNAKN